MAGVVRSGRTERGVHLCRAARQFDLAALTRELLPDLRYGTAWPAEKEARWAVSWLAAHEGWLLALDDVRDRRTTDLAGYGLHEMRTGTVVMTTRDAAREFAPTTTYIMGPDEPELARILEEIREQSRHAYEILGVVAWFGARVHVDLVRPMWPGVHAHVVRDALELLASRGVVQTFGDGSFLTSPMLRVMMRTPTSASWSEENVAVARTEAVRVLFDQVGEARRFLAEGTDVTSLVRSLVAYEPHVKALAEATPPSLDTVETAVLFFGVGLRMIWRDASAEGVRLGERACDVFDTALEGRRRERGVLAEHALSSAEMALAMSASTVAAAPDGVADLVLLIRRGEGRAAARLSERLLGPLHPLSASLRAGAGPVR